MQTFSSKRITFYPVGCEDLDCYHSYLETEQAIASGANRIKSTQLLLTTGRLLELEYEVWVDDGTYEYNVQDATERELQSGHNLGKLLVAGEFNPELFADTNPNIKKKKDAKQ